MDDATPAGGGQPQDVKGAILGFVNELKDFRANIQKQLQSQEERMTMLDRKTALRGRAPLSTDAAVEAPHQKAIGAYIRSGDDNGLRGLGTEIKGMTVASDGGFLLNPQLTDRIQGALAIGASLRQVANVVAIEASRLELLVETGEIGSAWAGESTAPADAATPRVDKVTIDLYELSAMPKASQRLLDDAAFDVEEWLAAKIADRFARAEANAFVQGDGVDKPRGFLKHPIGTVATAGTTKIGYIPTGTDGDFKAGAPADALVDLVYSLAANYRQVASFVMNSKTAGAVRKMKDADGRFLWTDSMQKGEPSRLMGYPVLIAEDMPDIAAGSYSIAFGDFTSGYTIVERPDLRILRDPFSAKPHVLFYASKRVGGGVTDARAIRLLKFSAT
ncbi:phage major capsid protein [Paracoccus pacificus]|uniref:Phage major capsid protein n=1 Tax=Paracoccus pacificus TaxID=1463598 RepID=A0ABW4R8D2_9RHOB